MIATFVLTSVVTLFAGFASVWFVRRLALRWGVLDYPGGDRKKHQRPTPLLGGVAVILACLSGVLVALPTLMQGGLSPKYLLGCGIAVAVVMIGGSLDDRFNLSPAIQILFPLLSVAIVVSAGIGINFISNPFGGIWQLDQWHVTLLSIDQIPYHLTLPADIFTIGWLLGMMYTTKFLDGVDGLVSGITAIGATIIAILSLTPVVHQPTTALLALIVAVAFGSFLVFNWNPASIFLGESGSLFAGFALGVLAIISGSKVATSLLIFALPALDVVWVVFQRLRRGRSPFQADRTHLHFRLIDRGWSTRQVVLFLYLLTAGFGAAGLLLQSKQKFIALIIAVGVLGLMGVLVSKRKQDV
jgi:UDP-GlcNAc:undecaprenyl-phosphate GlcNAc-1-phosphate transferase